MLADPRDYSLATLLFTELFNVVVLGCAIQNIERG